MTSKAPRARRGSKPLSEMNVVLLNNYIRRHHILAYQQLQRRVGQLTILLSTPMEPDRDWEADWEGLNVRVQKNLMYTAKWKHSTGFRESNFIHFPIDTHKQLESLNPDIVFSYEMGVRTLLSAGYRRKHPEVPLVMVGNMSQHIEKERGWLRRRLRRHIRNRVDAMTFNGPSCKRYLESLVRESQPIFHVPYCFDFDKAFLGDKTYSDDGVTRLLHVGALSERKGVLQFADALQRWSCENPTRELSLTFCGDGPLCDTLQSRGTDSLKLDFRGNCDVQQLRDAYAASDICVFPSLADEWGLVPIEAMASGVPVLGSVYAQSIETVAVDGANGWTFEPDDSSSLDRAISRAMSCSQEQIAQMGAKARTSVEHITPERTADGFCNAIESLLELPQSAEGKYRASVELLEPAPAVR